MFEYGLRNKKELWKAKTLLSYFRKRARDLLAAPEEVKEQLGKPLLRKLYKLGLLGENATIDDILNLTVRDILERRLQTVVYKMGLAKTIWQARQMIVHRHILVNGRICQSPGYLVKRDDKIELNPRSPYVKMLKEVEKGHLSERMNLHRNDEVGQMTQALDRFADDMQKEVIGSLQKLADGNLDMNLVSRDNQDEIRGAFIKLENDLNDVMASIQNAGQQISANSTSVSDFSQSLSQSATESAASLEEISASLSELSGQTKLNADNANQVNILSSEAKQATEEGKARMGQMISAMSEISEAGQSINKIIKVIDEIAFQTNLLALNAAVEAARAGQHGKGFAVVAEEVRNLAARSAKAASETAELIEGSVAKTNNGSQIANQTAESLENIFGGVSKVSDLAEEIAAASNEQASGIGQINEGVGQIDQAIQQNTATAEESAAAAEELSSQAAELLNMLKRFRLKGQNHQQVSYQPQAAASIPAPQRQQPQAQPANAGWGDITPSKAIALDDDEFGKF